jgi:hypothetical protein
MKECCSAKPLAYCNRNVILSSEHLTKICTCMLSTVGFYTLAYFALQQQLLGLWENRSVLICVVVHSCN